jgi:hypothetical protein
MVHVLSLVLNYSFIYYSNTWMLLAINIHRLVYPRLLSSSFAYQITSKVSTACVTVSVVQPRVSGKQKNQKKFSVLFITHPS